MPVTKALVIVTVIMFLFRLVTINTSLYALAREFIAFQTPFWIMRPWTAFTYPLMTTCGAMCVLFYCLMLWWFGGSLERSWGSRIYAWFFLIISGISAASVFVGSLITGAPVTLLGVGMPIAAITVAWAALNPEATILLYFVLPAKAKYVGMATAGGVALFFTTQFPPPDNLILAVFGLAGCFAAWRYVIYRDTGPRGQVVRLHRRGPRLPNPFRSLKEKRDSERLRRLFGEDKDDREHWR